MPPKGFSFPRCTVEACNRPVASRHDVCGYHIMQSDPKHFYDQAACKACLSLPRSSFYDLKNKAQVFVATGTWPASKKAASEFLSPGRVPPQVQGDFSGLGISQVLSPTGALASTPGGRLDETDLDPYSPRSTPGGYGAGGLSRPLAKLPKLSQVSPVPRDAGRDSGEQLSQFLLDPRVETVESSLLPTLTPGSPRQTVETSCWS